MLTPLASWATDGVVAPGRQRLEGLRVQVAADRRSTRSRPVAACAVTVTSAVAAATSSMRDRRRPGRGRAGTSATFGAKPSSVAVTVYAPGRQERQVEAPLGVGHRACARPGGSGSRASTVTPGQGRAARLDRSPDGPGRLRRRGDAETIASKPRTPRTRAAVLFMSRSFVQGSVCRNAMAGAIGLSR